VLGVILAAWAAVICLFLSVPVGELAIKALNGLISIFSAVIVGIGSALSLLAKLFTLGKALGTAEMAVAQMYSTVILAVVIAAAVIIMLYGYVVKTVRR
jgi:hypothetical protein